MASPVMIVEDDPDFASSLELALSLVDLPAVIAGSAEEAHQLFADTATGFNVVFFDIKLPGEDGISCFEKLRLVYPGLTGVVMTGFRDDTLIQRARAVGAVEVLLKPFKLTDFMALAKKYSSNAA